CGNTGSRPMSEWFDNGMLRDQVALVTGASRGIGAAIASTLAAAGAVVIGTATTEEGARAVSDALADRGRGAVLDIASDEPVQARFDDLQKREGATTVVVNNAGITRDNLLRRMKNGDWEAVLSTNLSGTYRVCKAALRGMMKAKRGRIVNIASVIGLMGNPGQASSAAAQAGVIRLSKSHARGGGSRHVPVDAVAAGCLADGM